MRPLFRPGVALGPGGRRDGEGRHDGLNDGRDAVEDDGRTGDRKLRLLPTFVRLFGLSAHEKSNVFRTQGGVPARLPHGLPVLPPRLRVDGVVAEAGAGVGIRVRNALQLRQASFG